MKEATLTRTQLDQHTADFQAKGGDVEEIETKSSKQIIADMRKKAKKGSWNIIDEGILEDSK